MKTNHNLWFILLEGASENSEKPPQFSNRTTDVNEALAFLVMWTKDPYSVSQVIVVSDKSLEVCKSIQQFCLALPEELKEQTDVID